jgi:hypothetical protein
MEADLGHDLGQVRVHSGPLAARAANSVGARAFTVGEDVILGEAAPPLATEQGQRLLAHELAHVLQQRRGGPPPGRGPESASERDAAAAASGKGVSQGTAVGIARDERHGRGYAGEQGMGFELYPQSEGWIFFEGPSGSAGHGTTQPGFDGVAYNTRTGELHLIDNKSLKKTGNVVSATAIDPSKNLATNVDGLIARVQATKDVPGRTRVLGRLRELKASLASGRSLPEGVHLVVTSVGGRTTDVTPRLKGMGVEHRDETFPGTATKPPQPKPQSSVAETGHQAGTTEPPKTLPEPTRAPVNRTKPPAKETVRPAAVPAEKAKPETTRTARPEVPELAPAKRLRSPQPEATEIPRGRPGSVDLIGHAQAGATGALMSQAVARLNEVARQYPNDKDLAWMVNTVNSVLDAEGFIKDPKGFVAGKIKAGIFDAVFSHYSEKLATIRQSFEDRFPSLTQIQKNPIGTGVSLESYRKDYEAARARLRIPGARRALLYAGVALYAQKYNEPPEVVQQNLREVDQALAKAHNTADYFEEYKWQSTRYQWTIYLLTSRLEQLSDEYADLPAGMAGDLRTRGQALHRAATVFRDTRDSVWQSGLVVFAPVLSFALDLEAAADGLDGIAKQFGSFATAVASRRAEYDREVQRLRAETTSIAERPLFGR